MLSLTPVRESIFLSLMAEDELLEIRRIRHEISARYGHDVDRYVDHLQELQERFRESDKSASPDRSTPDRPWPPAKKAEAVA